MSEPSRWTPTDLKLGGRNENGEFFCPTLLFFTYFTTHARAPRILAAKRQKERARERESSAPAINPNDPILLRRRKAHCSMLYPRKKSFSFLLAIPGATRRIFDLTFHLQSDFNCLSCSFYTINIYIYIFVHRYIYQLMRFVCFLRKKMRVSGRAGSDWPTAAWSHTAFIHTVTSQSGEQR